MRIVVQERRIARSTCPDDVAPRIVESRGHALRK
jgi:hypothetical protein